MVSGKHMVGITWQVVGGRHVEGEVYLLLDLLLFFLLYLLLCLLLASLLTHSRRALMKKSRASARHTAPTTM